MLNNRSMPLSVLIPVLAYDDVAVAALWLSRAFGLAERLRIGNHRIQLACGGAAMVARQHHADDSAHAAINMSSHAIMMRVDDVDAHYARAVDAGAQTGGTPTDFPFGERQYNAIDIGGHAWTFSQSIADVDPASWGGQLMNE